MSSHDRKFGAPNKKKYDRFLTHLKKYIGYVSNPAYGSEHDKTQSAYISLQNIYKQMSIGVQDKTFKGDYSK